VHLVLLLRLAEDEDVVQVHQGVVLARQLTINQLLEGVSGVLHAECQAGELKEAERHRDGCNGYVL